MKNLLLLGFASLLFATTINASMMPIQVKHYNESKIQDSNFGSLLSSLATGLKPTSFNKDWKTKSASFLNKIKAQDPRDLSGSASALFEFAKFLKPNIFEDSWKTQKGDFLRGVSQVQSASDLSKLFSLLLNNISPKAYTKEFKAKADNLKMSVGKIGQ